MNITPENVGDILCYYETGKRIRIQEVSDNFVFFKSETGETFTMRDFSADVLPEKDADRISRFEANIRIGEALNLSEKKALSVIAAGNAVSSQEREDAERVLKVVDEQRDNITKRLNLELEQNPIGKGLAEAFMSNLYEQGTGSHDTILGHRVENISQHSGLFKIDGKMCDYATAVSVLSQLKKASTQERKPGIDSIIKSAASRQSESKQSNKIMDKNFSR